VLDLPYSKAQVDRCGKVIRDVEVAFRRNELDDIHVAT